MLKDVAERDYTHKLALFVDDDESMHTGFAYRVVDGGHIIVYGTSEDTREVLLVLKKRSNMFVG